MIARGKRKGLFAVGLVLAGVLLYIAVRNVDLDSLLSTVRDCSWWYLVPFLVATYLFIIVKARRWGFLLGRRYRGRSYGLVGPTVLGAAGNFLLPHFGEVLRAGYLKRSHDIPVGYTLMGIGMERAFDLATLPLIVIVAVVTATDIPADIRTAATILLALGSGFLIASALFRRANDWICSTLTELLPERLAHKPVLLMSECAKAVDTLGNKKNLATVLLLTALQWLIMSGCIYCSLLAFDVTVPFSVALILTFVLTATLILPTAPGYLGSTQFAFVITLTQFGVSEEAAIAASVFYNIWITLPVVLWAALVSKRMLSVDGEAHEPRESIDRSTEKLV